jgi:hypothetical protein
MPSVDSRHTFLESEVTELGGLGLHRGLLLIDLPSVFQRGTSVLFDVVRVASRFRNGPTEEYSNHSWYGSHADHDTPEYIDANLGVVNLVGVGRQDSYVQIVVTSKAL